MPGDASVEASADAGASVVPTAPPQVLVRAQDGHSIRIRAVEGAQPEDLTQSLTRLSAGQDDVISISADGIWLVMATSRFGCKSTGCLALVRSDLSAQGELVSPSGSALKSIGRPVIAAGGTLVVFEAPGVHAEDLYATNRGPNGWTSPVLLTAASTHENNHDPSLSADAKRVAFDCGSDPYGDTAGTEPCEVATDGTGFRVLFPLTTIPGASPGAYTQRPTYAPDGTIVFEGNPGASEQIYRFTSGQRPVLVSNAFPDDNSPCVLGNGTIASLWLGRPGNIGSYHELKLMRADGSSPVMLIIDQDLVDIGVSCGGG
jgi:hypothetical protein